MLYFIKSASSTNTQCPRKDGSTTQVYNLAKALSVYEKVKVVEIEKGFEELVLDKLKIKSKDLFFLQYDSYSMNANKILLEMLAIINPNRILIKPSSTRDIPSLEELSLQGVPNVNVMCINKEIFAQVKSFGFKAIYIENSVDTDYFKPDATKNKKFNLITTSRIRPYKRIDTLLDAYEKSKCASNCLVVGAIDYYTAKSQENQVLLGSLKRRNAKKVIFEINKGKEFIRDSLRKSDIFVQTSEVEGMSNSLLEAMSCGLVCLATNIPGNQELLDNNFLFKSGDYNELMNKIDFLLSDSKSLSLIGIQNRQRVVFGNSLELISKKIYDVFCNNFDF